MDVIGVIDLAGGLVVHARGGRRDYYQPLTHSAGQAIAPGDVQAVARIYRDTLGLSSLYVADLDAIRGRPAQDDAIRGLAGSGTSIWLDCGVTAARDADGARARGASRIVVGLETLRSWDLLREVARRLGPAHVAFSLDLRGGVPVTSEPGIAALDAVAIATRAADAGSGTIIVLDLARVGSGAGCDLAILGRLRRALPQVMLLAGGGVRGPDDLRRLAAEGCDGALVATALHHGAIGSADLHTLRAVPRLPSG
jgi:phosphoribosylformimino-5-aminoimidazole carboxamide ribotide isomerase